MSEGLGDPILTAHWVLPHGQPKRLTQTSREMCEEEQILWIFSLSNFLFPLSEAGVTLGLAVEEFRTSVLSLLFNVSIIFSHFPFLLGIQKNTKVVV